MICSGWCRFFGIESLLALHGLLGLSYHMDQILGSRPPAFALSGARVH